MYVTFQHTVATLHLLTFAAVILAEGASDVIIPTLSADGVAVQASCAFGPDGVATCLDSGFVAAETTSVTVTSIETFRTVVVPVEPGEATPTSAPVPSGISGPSSPSGANSPTLFSTPTVLGQPASSQPVSTPPNTSSGALRHGARLWSLMISFTLPLWVLLYL